MEEEDYELANMDVNSESLQWAHLLELTLRNTECKLNIFWNVAKLTLYCQSLTSVGSNGIKLKSALDFSGDFFDKEFEMDWR